MIRYIVNLIIFCLCFTYAGTLPIGIRIYPSEILTVGLLMILFLTFPKYLYTGIKVNKGLAYLCIFILLFIIAHSIVLYSGNVRTIIENARLFLCLLLFLFLLGYVGSDVEKLFQLLKVYNAGVLLAAFYGFYQVFSIFFMGSYIPLLPNSPVGPNIHGRLTGTFMEPGYIVVYLCSGYLNIQLIRRLCQKYLFTFNRNLFLFCQISFSLAILLTFSTIGILAFLLSLFILTKRNVKIPALVLVTTGLISFFLLNRGAAEKLQSFLFIYENFSFKILTSFSNLNLDFSFTDRLTKILKGINMFVDNSLWGVGIGNYGFVYNDYPPLDNKYFSIRQNATDVVPLNIYIQILAEAGLVGFLLFSWFFRKIFKHDKVVLAIAVMLLLNFFTYPSYKLFFLWAEFAFLYKFREFMAKHVLSDTKI